MSKPRMQKVFCCTTIWLVMIILKFIEYHVQSYPALCTLHLQLYNFNKKKRTLNKTLQSNRGAPFSKSPYCKSKENVKKNINY